MERERKFRSEVYMERERRRNEVMDDFKVFQTCRGMIHTSRTAFVDFVKF